MMALGITNNKTENWLILAISIMALQDLQRVFPKKTLYMGAGFTQSRAKTSRPQWGAWYGKFPYGDDPRDQFWIKQGIDYARQHGY